MIRKADIILSVALVIIGLALSCFLFLGKGYGDKLVITVDGKEFGTYSLSEDRDIKVSQNSHLNKVTIKGGVVSMESSDCHGQDCVEHAPISKTGENIICLPNKVVVEITGNEQDFDAVSK